MLTDRQVAHNRKEGVLLKRSWGAMAESRLQSLPAPHP